ncbi:hypothetical protein VKT23_002774 [Stygiomarasmius scandens]|uniref:Uncharacterized protein n=1 Tax=Marasmiellus scandens TaxID=2682957 RepID=A0ABR1JW18_9AGAR
MRQKFSGGIHTLSNLTNHHSSEEAYQLPNTAVGNAVTGSGNGPISRNDDSSVEDLEAKIHVTKSIVTTWDQTT